MSADKRVLSTRVGDVPFVIGDVDMATEIIIDACARPSVMPVRLANAFCVATASRDQHYRVLLQGPGLTFPDGSPIVWFMKARLRRLREERPSQVRGPSLFRNVLDKGRNSNLRHYFLGTSRETLEALTEQATRLYPGIDIAGSFAPSYGPLSSSFYADASERIVESRADLVWVALGTPKQDFAAAQLSIATNRPCVGIGAAFDFLAGTTREAPTWMGLIGIEWLFRLASEPRRLFRRYTVGNARFLIAIAQQTMMELSKRSSVSVEEIPL